MMYTHRSPLVRQYLRLLSLLFGLTLLMALRAEGQGQTASYYGAEVAPGRIIVWYDEAAEGAGKAGFLQRHLARLQRTFSVQAVEQLSARLPIETWQVQGDVGAVLAQLNALPGIRAVPDFAVRIPEVQRRPLGAAGLQPQAGIQFSRKQGPAPVARRPANPAGSSKAGEADRDEELAALRRRTQAALRTMERPVVRPSAFRQAADGTPVVYADSLNDPAAVEANWTVFNFGPPESDAWTLVDSSGTGNYFFLAGKLESTYSDNMQTVAVSPLINLSDASTDKAFYLTFDFASALEICCDVFYLVITQDGEEFGTFNLSSEDGQLTNARIDITGLAGLSNIELQFVMLTDGSITPGFGALFDNVAILEAEPPPPPPTNDPFLALQWALHNDGTFEDLTDGTPAVEDADIDAFEAWEAATPFAVTPEGDTIAVVVFDTGVDLNHPDLQANLWVNRGEIPDNGLDDDRNGFVDDVYGYDAGDQDGYPDDQDGHGTHVAGIIGAVGNNGVGISGVAQRVKIIPVKLESDSGGSFFSAVLRGLDYISALLDQGVPVVASNHSWGFGFTFLPEYAQWRYIMEQFALAHYAKGHVWVASAGNAASLLDDSPFFDLPDLIQAPNIIAVAATNVGDEIASFSDYGKRTVEVAAPGQTILSTVPPELFGDAYAYFSGTSMAAPHVTGALALARALHPDENASSLIAGLTATADGGVGTTGFEDFVMAEGRLNLHYTLVPTATGEAGLLPGPETALLSQTALDDAARLSVGFANATGGPVQVQEVTISGADAGVFSLFTPAVISSGEGLPQSTAQDGAPAGGAYGVPVEFRSDGSKEFFEAALTFATSAGAVTIPLNARDKPFATFALEPEVDEQGFVPLGDTIHSTFTLSNNGNGTLTYDVMQTLVASDSQATARLQAVTKQSKTAAPAAKTPPPDQPSLRQLGRLTHAFAGVAREESKRPTVTLKRAVPDERQYLSGSQFSLSGTDLEVFWSDSLNNPEAVAENWEVIDVSQEINGVPSPDLWELEDVSAVSGLEGDLAFVAGDLTGTYQPGDWTGVWSPSFDFRGLAEDGDAPYYLRFDFGSAVEGYPFDFFYLNVIVDGEYYNTVAITGFLEDGGDGPQPLPSVSGMHEVLIDISDLAGRQNVEFLFLFVSDDIIEAGFGVLFDNPAILKGPAPYFASTYHGTVPPEGSDEVTVTVHTGLLRQGKYVLVTDIASDAAFFETPFSHYLYFETGLVGAVVVPPVAFKEPVYRGEPLSSTFTLQNAGHVPAAFEVIPSLFYASAPEDATTDSTAAGAQPGATFNARARAKLEEARKTASGKTPEAPPSLRAQVQRLMNTLPAPQGKAEKRGPAGDAPTAPYAARMLAAQPDLLYFEDFEDSSTFPEGWTVEDNRFGLATVWQIVDIGTPEQPNRVAFFGDPETLTYENLSETYAISPFIDLSGIASSQSIFLAFDYAAFLEPGYDFFTVFAGTADENGLQRLTPLASSEDQLYGAGTAVLDVSFLYGEPRVFFIFAATSDISVNEGYAYFDNVAVFTDEAALYAEPRRGELAVGESEEITLIVNTDRLQPGSYAAVAEIALFNADSLASNTASHVVFFDVLNHAPVAVDDTLGVVSGAAYDLASLLAAALGNDQDTDGDPLTIRDVTEPRYGDLKRTGFEEGDVQYVAPRDFDGYDFLMYLVTDGFDTDTARVTLAVRAKPEFLPGVQQQFTVLQGDSLTLSTMRLAAGVGGLDEDVVVWGETDEEALHLGWDFSATTITFWAEPDWYGQARATLFVGDKNNLDEPRDALEVTVVVTPLTTEAIIIVQVNGASAAFTSQPAAPQAGEAAIVAWHWDFGDGAFSTEPNPTHTYSGVGTYHVTLTTTRSDDEVATAATEVVIATLVGSEALADVPKEPTLFQNYPNPFNPETTIRFGLPAAQDVTLRVYNALGQIVATLYQQQLLPAGYHTVPFEASGLASGLYIYQLEADGPDGRSRVLATKKMALLK